MATLTEDDVLEQLEAQDNLFSFMKTAHSILLQGIRQFLPSLFVDNDEEINGCTPISRIFPSSGIT